MLSISEVSFTIDDHLLAFLHVLKHSVAHDVTWGWRVRQFDNLIAQFQLCTLEVQCICIS